jgi:polyhydroxyalkanoate synthesis regulator phasin
VEQILPTLATKADLQREIGGVRLHAEELAERGRLHTDDAAEKGRLHAEELAERGRLYTDDAAEKGRLHAEALAEKGRLYTDELFEKGRLHAEALAEKGRLYTDELFEKGRLHAEALAEKGRLHAEALAEKGWQYTDAVAAGLREEIAETRRHIDDRTHRLEVLIESIRDDVRLIAEGHMTLYSRQEDMWAEMQRLATGFDRRILRLEAAAPGQAQG